MMPTAEQLLVRRMLAGDERAFDEFFSASFSGLFRFALARLHQNADAAEEVVQATICKGIARLETYRGEASLFTWLCAICRHEISAYSRRLGSGPASVALVEDDAEVAAALESLSVSAKSGPEDQLRRQEVARIVHVVLDRLPTAYADALEWKYVDEVPVKEIAQRLGLSPKAAESLLTRARGAFRDGFSTITRRARFSPRVLPEAT